MVGDTWASRELPVLRAIVEIYESTGRSDIRVSAIEKATGFDKETVQQAIRLLYTEPYMRGSIQSSGPDIHFVGAPTGDALRVVGAWPSPEGLLERLVEGLERAAEDDGRPEEERSKLKQTALWLRGAASQVAIAALGGAGGNLIS